ncbi:MAG TPA: 50S ribosomal protein L11 methyltransferase [Burkholderiales bacterium]|nr:50S ribosomal protein L11 methyltransferase [Burkholderiales bacterium]
MSWISLILEAPAAHADRLSEALIEHGALSVSVEDAAAGTPEEQPLFGEPGASLETMWARSTVRALCASETDVNAMLRAASIDCGIEPPPYRIEGVPEQDWVRVTQAQFEPIQITPRLWIVPSWHAITEPNAVNLVLDPGLAFGTGSHPTTRLCLRWLEARVAPGMTMLDYGCGSGILAIAAAKFGAINVMGVDIDPVAVNQARLNAERNQVEACFIGTEESLSYEGNIVAANILAMPLKLLAPLLASHCKPGGRIVLAGLLDSQDEEVAEAYRPWFEMSVYAREEGWTALEGLRLESPQ